MGCRILSGMMVNEGDRPAACLYDSVTETAFGPLFRGDGEHEAEEEASTFLDWMLTKHNIDPRRLDGEQLEDAVVQWRKEHESVS